MTEKPGKYSGILNKAKASKPESQKADKADEVNLCVRVPKSYRQWWAGQAKLSGRSMTSVVIEALRKEFGLPE